MANSVIYRDLLLKNRHGLPLWKPDPDANLPEVYTKQGITIGDLGLLTDDGGFDYLFNIHADAHDPVNHFLGTPPSFIPLPLNTAKDVKKTSFQHPEKACITRNASFEVKSIVGAGMQDVSAADVSLAVDFTITEERAAILVLPHGADRYEAKAYGKYKTYVTEHAKSWYEYLNQIEQREARNGSLYLVTGCDKARSWGLAAGSPHHERTMGFSITAGSIAAGTVGFHASWRNTGGIESRHYPPAFMNITEDKNQCVFARGFVIGINENFFKKKWAGTVRTEQIASSSKPFPAIGNTVPFRSSPGRSVSSATAFEAPPSQDLADKSDPDDLPDSDSRDMMDFNDSGSTSGVFIQDYPEYPKPVLSPSSYICEHFLSSQPDIDVVLVHDDAWITATSSDAENIFTLDGIDYERLAARVLEVCHPIVSTSDLPSQQDNRFSRPIPEAFQRAVGLSKTRGNNKSSKTLMVGAAIQPTKSILGSTSSTTPSLVPDVNIVAPTVIKPRVPVIRGKGPLYTPVNTIMEGLPKATKHIVAPTNIPVDPHTEPQMPDIHARGPVYTSVKGSKLRSSHYPPLLSVYPPPGAPSHGYYGPSGYPLVGYRPSAGYAPSGYAPSSSGHSQPSPYSASSGYPPSTGYAPGGYALSGSSHSQPSTYPVAGGYPPPGGYPATDSYPAAGGYPAHGGYTAPGSYPPPHGGTYPGNPNNGSNYPGPSNYPSSSGSGYGSGGHGGEEHSSGKK